MSNSHDPTAWMWAHACDMLDEAEQLHRRFFRLAESRRALVVWEPPADIYEDEREIVIVVAMPGVSADRMQITSEPGSLVVRGARPLPLTGSGHAVRRLEIPYGVFERRIALPSGRLELGTPTLVNGCLIVNIRKSGEDRR